MAPQRGWIWFSAVIPAFGSAHRHKFPHFYFFISNLVIEKIEGGKFLLQPLINIHTRCAVPIPTNCWSWFAYRQRAQSEKVVDG